jgi:hypothetical protein
MKSGIHIWAYHANVFQHASLTIIFAGVLRAYFPASALAELNCRPRNVGSVQESGEVANWRGFGTFWAQEVVVEVGLPGPQATNLLEPSEGNGGGSEG